MSPWLPVTRDGGFVPALLRIFEAPDASRLGDQVNQSELSEAVTARTQLVCLVLGVRPRPGRGRGPRSSSDWAVFAAVWWEPSSQVGGAVGWRVWEIVLGSG